MNDFARASATQSAVCQELAPYRSGTGVRSYLDKVRAAPPVQMIALERQGVSAIFLDDLARQLGLPRERLLHILGVPQSSDRRQNIVGAPAMAAIAMVSLMETAQHIADMSTAEEAATFDTARWLGAWIERPHPLLKGSKPSDFLDTPTGAKVVERLLGAMLSGAYQ